MMIYVENANGPAPLSGPPSRSGTSQLSSLEICVLFHRFFHLVLHTYDCECFPFSPSSLPQLVGIIITVERADGPPFHLQRPMRHETVGAFFMRSIRYQEGGRASSASLMCKNPIWFCQSTCHRPPGHTLDDDPTCCCFFSRDHQHFFMQRCTCCSLEMSWGDFISLGICYGFRVRCISIGMYCKLWDVDGNFMITKLIYEDFQRFNIK